MGHSLLFISKESENWYASPISTVPIEESATNYRGNQHSVKARTSSFINPFEPTVFTSCNYICPAEFPGFFAVYLIGWKTQHFYHVQHVNWRQAYRFFSATSQTSDMN